MGQNGVPFTRRSILLTGAAGVASLAGCMNRDTDSPGDDEETRMGDEPAEGGDTRLIRLAAHTDGWTGIGPNENTDEENPTLRMNDDATYEIIWENRDGEQHQLVLADANGNDIASTEPAEEQAVTRSIEITAHDGMAEYYCEFHPDSMRGDVEVGGDER